MIGSNSGHYIALLLNRADPAIPSDIHNVLDPYLNRLQTELQPAGGQPARRCGGGPRRQLSDGRDAKFIAAAAQRRAGGEHVVRRARRQRNRVFPEENRCSYRT